MRILFFLSDAGGGGAQRTVVNLANNFSTSGHDVLLCMASGAGPARAWISSSVKLVDLAVGHVRSALLPLAGLIRTVQPEVMLATMVDANIVAWGACLLAGSGQPHLVLRETNSHRARGDIGFLRRHLIWRAYRAADRIVALSEGVREELIEDIGLPQTQVTTIHNPVDVEAWRERAQSARRSAPPWPPFGGDGPVLVAVGRLIRQKGFDLLLRALAQCQGAGRSARLVIVGEGPARANLTELARQLGLADRVLFASFVADPAPWYAHGDVFVLPSRWEGFGHVIVEAMACGLPVIAFDCPHGPRDILGSGEGGVLVAPEDVRALAAAIDRMLSAPGESARLANEASRSAERFSQARISADYTRLFETLTTTPAECPS